jgi:hypothetical protein
MRGDATGEVTSEGVTGRERDKIGTNANDRPEPTIYATLLVFEASNK